MTLKLGMQFWWLGGPIRFLQMMTLNWPWPILQLGQIQSLRLIYWKKAKLEFVHGIWVIWPRWLSYPYMANRLEILHLSGFWMATFRIYWKPKLLDWLNYLKLFTKSILIHAKGTLAWKLPYVTANKWNNTLSIAYFATKKKTKKNIMWVLMGIVSICFHGEIRRKKILQSPVRVYSVCHSFSRTHINR